MAVTLRGGYGFCRHVFDHLSHLKGQVTTNHYTVGLKHSYSGSSAFWDNPTIKAGGMTDGLSIKTYESFNELLNPAAHL